MKLSKNLLCLFNDEVEERGDSYVIEVPKRELEIGAIKENDTYRVALLTTRTQPTDDTEPPSQRDQSGPPVTEGDVVDVEIEDIGEQGDGIARVGPGYVVIVSDTDINERVAAEITEARDNVAFADVIERYDR